ncbi:MAG: hypothetical protein SVV03_02320 [Candidatus Nanohaloarchaea archaeon]|nr:hypothetical protein [Candidatus Nanohaloarchaea archaeon]
MDVEKILEEFEPQLWKDEMERLLPDLGAHFESERLFRKIEDLTNLAFPSHESKEDKKWLYFYIPLRRRSYDIDSADKNDGEDYVVETYCVQLGVVEFEERLCLFVPHKGTICIYREAEDKTHVSEIDRYTAKLLEKALEDVEKFAMLIEEAGEELIEQAVPYDVRTGKVKGKYVMDETLPLSEKEKIQQKYEKYLEDSRELRQISLQKYLDTAAICYRAAFEDALNLTPIEMYHKWADGRDNGMLDISDPESEEEFMDWQNSPKRGHPFEIVFSGSRHGIHLRPPNEHSSHFTISVTNLAYAEKFVKMVKALIRHGISFKAQDLDEVLEYLAGESWVNVNSYESPHIFYAHTPEQRENLFDHIVWDELEVVELKQKQQTP